MWQSSEDDENKSYLLVSSLCEIEKKDMFSNFAPTIFPVLAEKYGKSLYFNQASFYDPDEALPKEDEDGKDEES